jgi:cyclophilin family peptidyl-prolyl cis-trans isomerase
MAGHGPTTLRGLLAVGVLGAVMALVGSGLVWAQDEGGVPSDTAGTFALVVPGENPRVSITVSLDGEDGKRTPLGTLVVELYPADAPLHVENFLKLVEKGYYDGTTFYRIVPSFIVQGGDPISKSDWKSPRLGSGGPGYIIAPEIVRKHVRGAVAAGRLSDAVNPNRESNGSQFYICLADLPALDRGGYTVFGQVVEGMDVVDKISRVKSAGPDTWRALQRVEMTSVKAQGRP